MCFINYLIKHILYSFFMSSFEIEKLIKIVNKYDETKLNDFIKILKSKYNNDLINFILYDKYNYFDLDNKKKECEKRKKQNEFRRMIIKRDNKCIVSGAGVKVCEACHIKPFCDSNIIEKYSLHNGILLDSSIHKLFDSDYLVSINPETKRFEVSHKIIDKKEYENIVKYHNKITTINLNNYDYLKEHYNEFLKRR